MAAGNVHILTYVYIYIYTQLYAHTHTCKYNYTYIFKYIYINIYIYKYIHESYTNSKHTPPAFARHGHSRVPSRGCRRS